MAQELADQVQETPVSAVETPVTEVVAPVEGVKDGGQLGDQSGKEQKKTSVRESLEEAIAEETAKLEPKDKKEPTPSTDGRVRDPATGQFATKDAAPEKAAPTIPPTTEAKPATTQSSPAVSGPPSGWSKESKAVFSTLPPSVQSDAIRREQEFARGIEEYRNRVSEYERNVLPRSQRYGVKPAEYVERLALWDMAFENSPREALPSLIQAYPSLMQHFGHLLNPSTQDPQGQPQDPTIQLQPFLNQVGQVNQRVSSLESELQRSREERISGELAQFAKDHPHFEQVRVPMAQLMIGGAVQPNDLEGAYQRAIWADPNLRETLLAEKVTEQVKAAQLQAQNARKAAVSIIGRAPSGPTNGRTKSKGSRVDIVSAIEELRDQRA